MGTLLEFENQAAVGRTREVAQRWPAIEVAKRANAIGSSGRLVKLEASLDAAQALVHAVEAARMSGELNLYIRDVGFDRRHAKLQVSDVERHLVNSTTNMPEMFQNQILDFVCHHARPIAASSYHSASAPEIISISSLVIIAWRVRL
jgi:hypothetical protein